MNWIDICKMIGQSTMVMVGLLCIYRIMVEMVNMSLTVGGV